MFSKVIWSVFTGLIINTVKKRAGPSNYIKKEKMTKGFVLAVMICFHSFEFTSLKLFWADLCMPSRRIITSM